MKTIKCTRCCGTGKVGNYANVKAGVCFACNGTGRKHKMRRQTETVEVVSAIEGIRNTKVPCATESEAKALVEAWASQNVPGRVEIRQVQRITMVRA